MKIVGIDGKTYDWKYHLYQTQHGNSSALHVRARGLIKEIYPFATISEEIPLVGVGKERLYFDIYVPTQRLVLEINGSQHYSFNPFFFNSKQDYGRALNRDRTKKEWCLLNNIDLIELPYNEKDEEWEKRIRNR